MFLGLFREMTCDGVVNRFNESDTAQIRTTGLRLLLSKAGPRSRQLLQPNSTQLSTCSGHVCMHVHTCILHVYVRVSGSVRAVKLGEYFPPQETEAVIKRN